MFSSDKVQSGKRKQIHAQFPQTKRRVKEAIRNHDHTSNYLNHNGCGKRMNWENSGSGFGSQRKNVHKKAFSSPKRVHRSKGRKKKMVIKPFKVKPKVPESFFEDFFRKLQFAVTAVHEMKAMDTTQEELYRAVESLCIHKRTDALYTQLYSQCEIHTVQTIQELAAQMTMEPVPFLSIIQKVWKNHCDQMNIIRCIFLYLDRTYVMQNTKMRSLWAMGLHLFRTNLVESECDVQGKTVTGMLVLIEKERQGENVDHSLIKEIVRMFSALKIYQSSFEPPFLEATQSFFNAESHRLLIELSVPNYLVHCDTRLQEEENRIKNYLAKNTRTSLITLIQEKLIQQHVKNILKKGFKTMMKNNRTEELSLLYNLVEKVECLEELKDAWSTNIKEIGSLVVRTAGKERIMIATLLKFKTMWFEILNNSFKGNKTFLNSLKIAFDYFINIRENVPAELIAKYIDRKMRIGARGSTDKELQKKLDELIFLFRYIHAKDVFSAFYRKELSKRLLLGKSASIETEKSMIAKFKHECGSTYTSKFEGMFKDMVLSKNIMREFTNSSNSELVKDNPKLEFNVHVLTSGCWPVYKELNLCLPSHVKQLQEQFKVYYLGKHTGRRLVWQNFLSTCLLDARFERGKKEFKVSGAQACVLMLFNECSKLTYKEIHERSGIPIDYTRAILKSLTFSKAAKTWILIKEPKNMKITKDDTFCVNTKFKHKLFRITINHAQAKETKEEHKRTTKKIFQNRQYAIDAAIVRIMKARSTLSHPLLMSEVFSQINFPAKPIEIKRRIASLLEREYMKRDNDNPKIYHYLA